MNHNDLLLVIDMQEDFINGPLGNEECKSIVRNMPQFIRDFRAHGRVIFTKDVHGEDYLETEEGKNLPVKHCIKGTHGCDFIPEIADSIRNYDRILFKHTFGSWELADVVSLGKYDNIYLCGVCTGICVIANAVIAKTYSPESRIHVLKDLCACVTPESHENALKAMELLQVDVMESGEYHV